jgi:hypothetical protein
MRIAKPIVISWTEFTNIAICISRVARMTNSAFDDKPPIATDLTPYDERHLVTYLRLLDAAEERADWREVVKIIFGLDPVQEPDRARIVYDAHLARARWMTEAGYRHLLRSATN